MFCSCGDLIVHNKRTLIRLCQGVAKSFLNHLMVAIPITALEYSIVNYLGNQKHLYLKFPHILGNLNFFHKRSSIMNCPLLHKISSSIWVFCDSEMKIVSSEKLCTVKIISQDLIWVKTFLVWRTCIELGYKSAFHDGSVE